MRGRIIFAVLVLGAFCASYGAPLQPLFSRSMSCCPSGKASSCCKRTHAAGWTAGNSSCASACVGAFASPAPPAICGDLAGITAPASPTDIVPRATQAHTASSYQAFLYQRPPPPAA